MQNSWGGIVTHAKVVGDEAVVTLKSADDKGQLLQMLADKPVDAVRVIEPSLEEIFVETAGDGQ
jgi:ABC-type uncharacterized transport system ATPase subunit